MNDISALILFFLINNITDLSFLLGGRCYEIANRIDDHGDVTVMRCQLPLEIMFSELEHEIGRKSALFLLTA